MSDPDGRFPWKLITTYLRITSPFGQRIHPTQGIRLMHWGQDVAAPIGSPVHSLARGKVVGVQYQKRAGYFITVSHGKGWFSRYMHLKEGGIKVKVGDEISNGQIIAESGNTGIGTGPHLHFEIGNAETLEEFNNNKEDNRIDPTSIEDLDQYIYGDDEDESNDRSIIAPFNSAIPDATRSRSRWDTFYDASIR